jgi:hypothetical protein
VSSKKSITVNAAMVAAARAELDPSKPGPHTAQIKRALEAALAVAPQEVPQYRQVGASWDGMILYVRVQ